MRKRSTAAVSGQLDGRNPAMGEADDDKPASLVEVEAVSLNAANEAQNIDDVPVAPNKTASDEESGKTLEQEESEEETIGEEKPEIKLETAPADFRFPTTNQTRHCFTRYIEYHRCIAAKGDDISECNKFAKYYRALCPDEWIERWNEQRENGTFPGPI
ncbi:hypothetical protein HPP92_009005 [Vanilla planifolia]|uniref:Cytochrome c oxidase subunit 6b-1 n=1 Tax=Vanilla planifolia TaxID=51239 RepID=A0A835V7R8_VANPL|nr:hypothetical protein HPP92_009005 [Vanilla planifolia]